MVYQIDQSGKIEQTNLNTILCISNATWHAITIQAKTKRQLQEIFRRNGQIRNFILFTFCAGLSLLLTSKQQHLVIIDREYYGKEAVIKSLLLKMVGAKKLPQLRFALIGKESPAHVRALAITRKQIKAKETATIDRLLKAIKKTEVGNRLKDI